MKFLGFYVSFLVLGIFSNFIGASPPVAQVEEWRPEIVGDVLESTLVRYYVFQLENPETFQNGGKAEFSEIGPFTYRERRVKTNLKRLNESALSYDIKWSMHYLPELTGQGLSENTKFTAINVPLVTMAEGLANVGLPKNFNDILIDEVIEAGEKLYRTELGFGDSTFYGYNVSIYTDILDDITQGQTEERYPELAGGKFAFFKNKNDTITGKYAVESTADMPFGRILTFQGAPDLGFWNPGTHCDRVKGSLDFFTFPKHISKDTVFNVFLPENCRSLRMEFVHEDVFRGVPVYVYKFPLEQFSNNLVDDETSCYCYNQFNMSNPQCLEPGLMDYSGCSKGAPLVGSFPHFLHANPSHWKNVKGIMPNKSLHESEVMIEPITGTPLYAVRRFQLNVRMHSIPSVTYFENVTEQIMPLAWFEHILEVPSSTFTAVKDKLESLKKALSTASNKDIYKHEDESPIEVMDGNDLFARRSNFPGSQDEEESPQPEDLSVHNNSSLEDATNSSSASAMPSSVSFMTCYVISLGYFLSRKSSIV